MVLAEKRRKLFGITYPRDHFYSYDLETNEYKDIGRIGDINPQSIFIDKEENAYTVDDFGYLVKYDADARELIHLDVQLPYANYRDGTYNLIYDSVPSPDGESIYGVHWNVDIRRLDNRLFRYDFHEGPQGKISDLGWAYRPPEAGPAWKDTRKTNNHTGGLVFGEDCHLYYATYFHWKESRGMYLIRMNVQSLEREVICPIEANGFHAQYIAKATRDYAGNLYLACCGSRPTRVYIYTPPYVKERTIAPRWPLVRSWG